MSSQPQNALSPTDPESTFQRKLRERRATPLNETTLQRRIRERRIQKAAAAEAQLRAEATRLAMEQMDREELEREQAAKWGDLAGVGLEDYDKDDTTWDDDELNRRYFIAGVNGILADMRQVREGQRNHTLNILAMKLGQLSAGLGIHDERALLELGKVAMSRGLGKSEVIGTINSGFKFGVKNPRSRG